MCRWECIEAYCFHKISARPEADLLPTANTTTANNTKQRDIGLALFTKPVQRCGGEEVDPILWDACEKVYIWPVEKRQLPVWCRLLRHYTRGRQLPMTAVQTNEFLRVRSRFCVIMISLA